LSANDTLSSEFYCMFYNGPFDKIDPLEGWKITTSCVPNKVGMFAEIKSTNYLQNALNVMGAQDNGGKVGIFMHDDGTVCEGPNLNVGIITSEGIVKVPPFKECLAGCTVVRLMELVQRFLDDEVDMESIKGVEQVRTSGHIGRRHAVGGQGYAYLGGK
jgi:branched-subunit amino acid aminotransferase/4-amino-4-deoxychorismate lyase